MNLFSFKSAGLAGCFFFLLLLTAALPGAIRFASHACPAPAVPVYIMTPVDDCCGDSAHDHSVPVLQEDEFDEAIVPKSFPDFVPSAVPSAAFRIEPAPPESTPAGCSGRLSVPAQPCPAPPILLC